MLTSPSPPILSVLTQNVKRFSSTPCKLVDMGFPERMKLARKRAGLTQEQAAEAIGCSRATVGMWETTGDGISGEYLSPAASVYKVRPEWITTGKGGDGFPWEARSVVVPAYSVRVTEGEADYYPATEAMVSEVDVVLSAGNGHVVPEFVETTFRMPFQAYWFDKYKAKAENVKLMRVQGASMERFLFDGDRVAVHLADKRILDGKVYALIIGEEAKVKRLFKLRDGSLRVVSENADKITYPDEIVPPDGMGEVWILGRVIDKSGGGGL